MDQKKIYLLNRQAARGLLAVFYCYISHLSKSADEDKLF